VLVVETVSSEIGQCGSLCVDRSVVGRGQPAGRKTVESGGPPFRELEHNSTVRASRTVERYASSYTEAKFKFKTQRDQPKCRTGARVLNLQYQVRASRTVQSEDRCRATMELNSNSNHKKLPVPVLYILYMVTPHHRENGLDIPVPVLYIHGHSSP
jgi:hypothetical protein